MFTVADVPGLVPGASSGRGLGLEFLRHVERCTVLVHVVDCATVEPGRDPVSDLEQIEAELAAYDERRRRAAGRPRIVALNKMDVPDARELADMVRPRSASGSAYRCSRSRRHAGPGCASSASRWPRRSRPAGRAAGRRADPDRAATRAGPRRRLHGRAGRGAGVRRPRRPAATLGASRPTSATTRRSGTSLTGWPGSGSRTRWQGSARRPARRSRSARSRSTGSRRCAAGGVAARRPRHRRAARGSQPGRRRRAQGVAQGATVGVRRGGRGGRGSREADGDETRDR